MITISGITFTMLFINNQISILNEMLEILNLERSRYYDRKKETVMIFAISLWGTAIPKYRRLMS